MGSGPVHYRKYVLPARERNRKVVQDYKSTRPCIDCNLFYPFYVMHFDHLGDKYKDVSELANKSVKVQVILDEMAKCELVCSNCHAERTYQRAIVDR